MTLISMTDFVLEQELINGGFGQDEIDKVWDYANFLKQPLELWMFVPCDEDGNVLEEPSCMYIYNTQCFECSADEMYRCRKYLEAKERCLFDGFELKTLEFGTCYSITNRALHVFWKGITREWKLSHGISTIEDLVKYDLQLTKSAIKQLGL